MSIRILLTSLLVTILCTCARAQCPTNLDVVLTSQSDVDLHLLLYPNCTELNSLTLGDAAGSDIDNIAGFTALRELDRFSGSGQLLIENTQLTNLSGLNNLDRLRTIIIRDNPELTSLTGLADNTFRGVNNLTITDNPLLADCTVGIVCNTIIDQGFSTNIDISNWTDNTGWADLATTGDCDYCAWAGVTCDGNGRVTGLDLANNNLSGELFAGLEQLNFLTSLDLSNNNLTGCYPVVYASFCGITTDFSGNAGLPQAGSSTFFTGAFCPNGLNPCDSDCPVVPVTLTTDAEIAAFVADWPNCTQLTSDLTIAGSTITSLSPLGDLEGVAGNLTLQDLSIELGQAFVELASLGGDLIIDDCPNITTVNFSNLNAVGGGIVLRDLPALTTYLLDEITTLTGDLTITRTGLTVLDGFTGLTSIDGDLFLFGNTALTSIDLDGDPGARQAVIASVGGLTVAGNPVLTSLVGLPAFTISGDMTIASNTTLATCEATAVCNKLSDGTGTINVVGNATGCANTTEVANACLALPVSWVDFTAEAGAKTVLLRWITAGEEQNAGFTVERSANGRDWSALGFQPALAAGTDGLHHYAFTDSQPLSGTSFYRLQQEDLDGAQSFSAIREVTLAADGGLVYPNPSDGTFQIVSNTPQTVQLYSVAGRLVRTYEHAGGGARVRGEGLRSGVYWLRFSATGEAVKLVVR